MGCSEGSVKTHCSRAVHALAKPSRPRELRHEPTRFRTVIAADPEALQARFALRVAARLNERAAQIAPRRRRAPAVCREQALEKARAARLANANAAGVRIAVGSSTLALSGGPSVSRRLVGQVGSVLPLVALVGGLVLIQQLAVRRAQIDAAAEIDCRAAGRRPAAQPPTATPASSSS